MDKTFEVGKMDYEPKISIIILNWNGWKDTIECLESLYQIDYKNYDIIVLDNGSNDNSIEMIRAYCKSDIPVQSNFFNYSQENKPISILEYVKDEAEASGNPLKEKIFSNLLPTRKLRLILAEKNYGFAEGNNIAVRYACKAIDPDYILILNNDTVVDKKFLVNLAFTAKCNEHNGIISPKVLYYDSPLKIQSMGFRIIWYFGLVCPLRHNAIEEIKKIDFVSGCAMLIKNDKDLTLSLFNPKYFVYWEDVELCERVRRLGYGIMLSINSKVWHKVSTNKEPSSFKEYYGGRNLMIFMKEYLSKEKFCLFLTGFFSIGIWYYIYNIIKLYRTKKIDMVSSFVKGVLSGLLY